MNMSEPEQFIAEGLRGEMRYDVPMGKHTSWRAGGTVQRMYQPADLDDLLALLRQLPADEPLVAVGLGSNLLVRDGGLRGTVLLLHGALSELRLEENGSVSPQGKGRGCKATEVATTTLYAEAGVPGAKLARFAALHNLHGAEFFAGIPGTVGGMLAMNAGCYGSEIWQKVLRVLVATRSGEPAGVQMEAYWRATRAGRRRRTMPCRIGSQSQRGRSTTSGSLRNSARKSRTAPGVAAVGVPRLTSRRCGAGDRLTGTTSQGIARRASRMVGARAAHHVRYAGTSLISASMLSSVSRRKPIHRSYVPIFAVS